MPHDDRDFRVDTFTDGAGNWSMRVTDLVSGRVDQAKGTRDGIPRGYFERTLKDLLTALRPVPRYNADWPPQWAGWETV